jgi:hypothetical protein
MSESSNVGARVSLTLCFEPLAEQIGSLRGVLSDLCKPHLSDPDELSRVLLAAHELLENIVKYSTGGVAEFHFALEPSGAALRVRLRTKNLAHPERLADVGRRLDALRNAPDPVSHYDDLIRAAAGRRDGSGLGLARIPAESELELAYTIEHDWLILTAEGRAKEKSR